MFPDTILGEQLANLQNNRQTWKLIQEKPATRPSTLPLISTVEAQVEIPEVPSPTESLESGSDLDECPSPAYDRRHSVPVLTLLEDSTILSRRQSFPDGQNYTRLNLNRAQKMYEVLLLDNVVRPDSNLTSVTNSGNNIAIAFEDIGSSTCSRSALVPASPHSMTYLLEGQWQIIASKSVLRGSPLFFDLSIYISLIISLGLDSVFVTDNHFDQCSPGAFSLCNKRHCLGIPVDFRLNKLNKPISVLLLVMVDSVRSQTPID